uniref:Protein kinase domain-containing protein n=1 Tax=Chlamydomonas leiostraca TaxID=1034604 RepID=A0A7S0RXX0_9CHLO|mmetsp:Transcript_34131/g.86341  ORF Transcript_34131/g.86341 Transcript_34131/m.86341 type:complete len:607 (+) Transcript_34131:510-2330(+)
MVADLSSLSFISRGASSFVFQGIWQSADVAVKFLVSGAAGFSVQSASVREALLGTELAHPNVVQCYAARCVTLDEEFIRASAAALEADTRSPPAPPAAAVALQEVQLDLSAASPADGLRQHSFDSGDGFGPPPVKALPAILPRASSSSHTDRSTCPTTSLPSTPAFSTARLGTMKAAAGKFTTALTHSGSPSVTSPKPQSSPVLHNGSAAAVFGASPLVRAGSGMSRTAPASRLGRAATVSGALSAAAAAHNPWGPGASWGKLLRALQAAPGQVLTLIIAEFCDLGNLSGAIHGKQLFVLKPSHDPARLPLRALLRTAREVAMGLNHLHTSSVIHGDLKPANVVLSGSRQDRRGFVAKLTDLGLSRVLPGEGAAATAAPDTAGTTAEVVAGADWGTTPYMAPEHLAGKLSKASDVYSLGVMVWEMAHGRRPYAGLQPADIVQGVAQGSLGLTWEVPAPAPLIALVAACLSRDPDARPTAQQVILALTTTEAALREDIRAERLAAAQASQSSPAHVSLLTRLTQADPAAAARLPGRMQAGTQLPQHLPPLPACDPRAEAQLRHVLAQGLQGHMAREPVRRLQPHTVQSPAGEAGTCLQHLPLKPGTV